MISCVGSSNQYCPVAKRCSERIRF
jgi:hypothetical protein